MVLVFVPYIVFPIKIRKWRNLLLKSAESRLTPEQFSFLKSVFDFNPGILNHFGRFVLLIGMIDDDYINLFSKLLEEVKKHKRFKDPFVLLKKFQLMFSLFKKDFFVLLTNDQKISLVFLSPKTVMEFLNLGDKSQDPENLAKKIVILMELEKAVFLKNSKITNKIDFLQLPLLVLNGILEKGIDYFELIEIGYEDREIYLINLLIGKGEALFVFYSELANKEYSKYVYFGGLK